MAVKIMKQSFEFYDVTFERHDRKRILLNFSLKNNEKTLVEFWAGNPPDYTASFSGSALPFPDSQIAYENSPNKGKFTPKNGKFKIDLLFPNAYYSHLGTRYIEPHVVVQIVQNGHTNVETIFLGEIAPFRLLTYPGQPRPRENPTFYDRSHLTVPRSQEAILRSGGYPNMNQPTPKNFWGGFVPQP